MSTELLTNLVFGVGILAFVISIITEVTKNIGFLAKIPTSLQVIVLSLILTPVAFIAYASHISMALTWYTVFGSVIAGFFVAFVCMYGWDKLSEIYNKFKKN